MRIVHDVDSEMQVCGALNGSLVSLTAASAEDEGDGELINIEGDPKYIVPMLKEMLAHVEMLLEAARGR